MKLVCAWVGILAVMMPLSVGGSSYAARRVEPGKPLRNSVVVGRRIPSFRFRTESGAMITPRTFEGRCFLIDIWSVT